MVQQEKTLTIIGAGAAGLTAAIAAARAVRACGSAVRIRLYEKDDRVGRSILATGNGRCNFSNASIQVRNYHHAPFVEATHASSVLAVRANKGIDAVHGFFQDLGLVWREEEDGRQFPLANKASVVLDVLRARVAELGVSVECDREVEAIEAPGVRSSQFMLRLKSGRIEHTDSVIVACGGHNASAIWTEFVPRIEATPVLGPLSIVAKERPFARELDNIRARVEVSLWRKQDRSADASSAKLVTREVGELMFRKYGVSGICIFNLSRFAQQGDIVRIDFLQDLQEDPDTFLRARFETLRTQAGSLTYEDMLRGLVLPRIAEVILKRHGIALQQEFSADSIEELERLLTCFDLEVEGIADEGLCQVQRGGLDVDAFEAETLQSRTVPGFFAAGEALDVDGPCGGYNLDWAWASGLVAGESAVKYLMTQESEVIS